MKRRAEDPQDALMWFRTDLRTTDNLALSQALEYAAARKVKLQALYVFSIDELEAQGIGPVRLDFVLRTLRALEATLTSIGVPLHVLVLEAGSKYPERLVGHCKELHVGPIFFNKECDPVAIQRDAAMKPVFDANGISYQDFSDQCIVQEGFILTKLGKPYVMFTPFKATWMQYLKDVPVVLHPHAGLPALESPAVSSVPKSIPGYGLETQPELDAKLVLETFPAGEDAALAKFRTFLTERGKSYKASRDTPAIIGTSMISPYLAVGALSPRTVFEEARLANHGHLTSGSEGLQTFISELCWRDFYRHIFHLFPQIAEGKPFKPEAMQIAWREGPDADADFAAWCAGATGIPIVDAAMRQLVTTGWMHNRLRMIVAAFLTKDLLVSWRKGETWFARHLIDYDFCSNNGGWQWSSSTGTDSQPYFRIFNPYRQSETFDADGTFIRRLLPVLGKVPAPAIHDPNERLKGGEKARLCPKYPATIVDHSAARLRAIEVFKTAFRTPWAPHLNRYDYQGRLEEGQD